jgi:SMC interacting uncharacterized protein involved in chromosome segregation
MKNNDDIQKYVNTVNSELQKEGYGIPKDSIKAELNAQEFKSVQNELQSFAQTGNISSIPSDMEAPEEAKERTLQIQRNAARILREMNGLPAYPAGLKVPKNEANQSFLSTATNSNQAQFDTVYTEESIPEEKEVTIQEEPLKKPAHMEFEEAFKNPEIFFG